MLLSENHYKDCRHQRIVTNKAQDSNADMEKCIERIWKREYAKKAVNQ